MEVCLVKKNFTLNQKNTNNEKNQIIELKPYHFLTINEIRICNKIKTIPYYFNYFQVVTTYKMLKDSDLTELFDEEYYRQYSLLTYNNEHGENTYELKDDLLKCLTPKHIISHSIETYLNLLNSLLMLNKNKITFFDMAKDNIYFTEYHKPILKGFDNSIFYEHLDETYMTHIIKNTSDFTYKPLEIHLLFYLIINDEDSLSYELSYEICERFIATMPVLSLFSLEYRENYKRECNVFLNSYVNKSRSEIMCDVIKYHYTWDNYSLSILYLHIFAIQLHAFSLTGTFINDIVNSLTNNLSINPLKRETLLNSLSNFNCLMSKHTDWTYATKIPQEQLKRVHDLL